MRILMLGNSFTYANDMPGTLAALTGGEVVHHTRGGARLSEQLDPGTELGERTRAALEREQWDFVVLQEMSCGPITGEEEFRASLRALCPRIRRAGAAPVLFATWAYRGDCPRLGELGMSREEMFSRLWRSCRRAAEENGALLAPAGARFWERGEGWELYAPDGYHPSPEGSRLAAETIAAVLLAHPRKL